ncbi:MAG: MFS transporter [Thermoflexales bacterium]|nr:MFS transporter [Thermoflexales bacterium]MDW8350728.1 MFS transporter [Anaerolineae bacterium]
MTLSPHLAAKLRNIETQLAGLLEDDVRYNLRVEIVSAVAYGVFMAALTFLPAVLTDLGGMPVLVSVYLSLSYLGHIFSGVSLLFMRKLTPKAFAVTSWTLGRLIFMLTAIADGAPLLLAIATVMWLLEIVPNPAYARILQSIYPISHRGKIMALVRFGMALTILVATPLIGLGLDRLGYPVVFLLAGVFGLLSSLVFIKMRIMAEPSGTQLNRSSLDAMRIVMHNRRFMTYQIGVVLFGIAILTASPLYPDVQINRLQLSYTDLGLLGLIQSVSWLVGYFIWGRIVDRYGALRCITLTFVILAVAPVAYAFATSGWMLVPAFIATGLVTAGADIGLTSSCLELSEPDRTQEYAVAQSTIIGLRGFVAPFLGVGLLGLGIAQPVVFLLASSLALLAAFCSERARRM